MRIENFETPREFNFLTPMGHDFHQKDCGRIYLDDNELITFITASGKEHDVVGKDWGFFATQSMNKRLKEHGFKSALIRSAWNRLYIALVDTEKFDEFFAYLHYENYRIERWLDEEKPER